MLKNKVVLVTGAASGIGRAIALTAAREGALLVLSDIDADAGVETGAMVRSQGGESLFVAADVGSADECQALVSQAMAHFGRLDVACNNAGIEGRQAPITEYDVDVFKKVIDINLMGTMFGAQAAIPRLKLRQNRQQRLAPPTALPPARGGIDQKLHHRHWGSMQHRRPRLHRRQARAGPAAAPLPKPTRSRATVSQIVPKPWGNGTLAALSRWPTDFLNTMIHHTSTTYGGACFIRFYNPSGRS